MAFFHVWIVSFFSKKTQIELLFYLLFLKVVNDNNNNLLEVNVVVIYNFGEIALLAPQRAGKSGHS